MNAKPHGFTLLEVMVALAIIAIALSAMIVSAGRDAANVGYLRDKTFAHWTAMNVVAEMQARREFPNPGQHLGSETLAGREWFYVMDVEPTRIESMRRVDIVIRGSRSQRDPVLARLSSFYDVPPALPEKDK